MSMWDNYFCTKKIILRQIFCIYGKQIILLWTKYKELCIVISAQIFVGQNRKHDVDNFDSGKTSA